MNTYNKNTGLELGNGERGTKHVLFACVGIEEWTLTGVSHPLLEVKARALP